MKDRLDRVMVARGLVPSRARAQAEIKAGTVQVDSVVVRQPSRSVREAATIQLSDQRVPFVSRGGVKLAHALDHYRIDPAGQVCLDLGASTGGFTDVMLRRGVAHVYAVDVGRGQLHASLVEEPRVTNLEATHANLLSPALVPQAPSLIVCDVSFISMRKVLGFAMALCAPGASLVSLIKPQFELGPDHIGRGGIVRAGEAEIVAMLNDVSAWLTAQGWTPRPVIDSPIKGGDGNQEFLIAADHSAPGPDQRKPVP
ncbi:MAG: TlyA family RNA methyltransferase [Pseudomonadota bacterium]